MDENINCVIYDLHSYQYFVVYLGDKIKLISIKYDYDKASGDWGKSVFYLKHLDVFENLSDYNTNFIFIN